jgi:altronate hydrolase
MGEAIMESRHPVLRLHKKDNVVVALRDLSPGEFIEEERVQVMEAIPKGHKVATTFIPEGTRILKYGHTIGIAKKDIPAGSWVHTHNLAVAPRRRRYAKAKALEKEDLPEVTPRAKFLGIPRSNGRIGTRNYIGIISTVNCSATVARRIADALPRNALSRSGWSGCPRSRGEVVLAKALGRGSRHSEGSSPGT